MAWISGNRYLSISEMQNTVDILHYFFRSAGWTDNAIAAMLGNMQSESTINPGIWEGLTPPAPGQTKVGYGLVQWTPYTHYSDWAGEGWQDNGQKEMERIIYELSNGLQWISTDIYPMTFEDFTLSQEAPSKLAQVWLYNYERPEVKPQPIRSTRANYWYQYITGQEPPTPPTPSDIPIWLMFKMKERRW